MCNRPKHVWQGGDYVQMEETAKALRAKGIDVEIDDQFIYVPAIKYRHFDIIHTFNFSMPWTPLQMGLAFSYKKPTVCSMIYHDREDFVPFKDQQHMADTMTKAVFINHGEVERFKKKVNIDDSKVEIVPNGIDEFWFKKCKKVEQRPYVLTVGRIEPHKGQLAVAKACKNLGIKYIMAGMIVDSAYAELCEAAGAIYQSPLSQKPLRQLYANSSCVVLNSKAEIQPLTIMEAGAQAKNVVVSNQCLWKDIPGALWVECNDIVGIKNAIEKAITLPPNKTLQEHLKNYTWSHVADKLIKIYESTLRDNHELPLHQ